MGCTVGSPFESRGACGRCDDLVVAVDFVPVCPYVEVEGLRGV